MKPLSLAIAISVLAVAVTAEPAHAKGFGSGPFTKRGVNVANTSDIHLAFQWRKSQKDTWKSESVAPGYRVTLHTGLATRVTTRFDGSGQPGMQTRNIVLRTVKSTTATGVRKRGGQYHFVRKGWNIILLSQSGYASMKAAEQAGKQKAAQQKAQADRKALQAYEQAMYARARAEAQRRAAAEAAAKRLRDILRRKGLPGMPLKLFR